MVGSGRSNGFKIRSFPSRASLLSSRSIAEASISSATGAIDLKPFEDWGLIQYGFFSGLIHKKNMKRPNHPLQRTVLRTVAWVRRLTRFLRIQQTKDQTTHMKTD